MPERYKCYICKLIIHQDCLVDGCCPVCHTNGGIKPMCENDHICTCAEEVHSSVSFCPKCGSEVCPQCGSHDVFAVSRVTGYLAELRGFNEGKRQEVRDRVHTNL